MDLSQWVKDDLLRFSAVRPTAYSLEMHLAMILKMLKDFQPSIMLIDPISNLYPVGDDMQVRSVLMRLIDHAKTEGITAFFTSLTHDPGSNAFALEPTAMHVSSLMDTWLILKNVEGNGERNRAFSIIKSRGMAHSNQLREFVLSDSGIDLVDIYQGGEGVLLGSARIAQEIREKAVKGAREEEIGRQKRDLERKRKIMEAEIVAIRERFAREEEEASVQIGQAVGREEVIAEDRQEMARSRRAED